MLLLLGEHTAFRFYSAYKIRENPALYLLDFQAGIGPANAKCRDGLESDFAGQMMRLLQHLILCLQLWVPRRRILCHTIRM